MRTLNRRVAWFGLTWLATAAVILLGLTFLPRTGTHAPSVPAVPVLVIGVCLCVAGAVVASRYRHQWLGLALGGPGTLLVGLALAQR